MTSPPITTGYGDDLNVHYIYPESVDITTVPDENDVAWVIEFRNDNYRGDPFVSGDMKISAHVAARVTGLQRAAIDRGEEVTIVENGHWIRFNPRAA